MNNFFQENLISNDKWSISSISSFSDNNSKGSCDSSDSISIDEVTNEVF